MSRRVAAAGGYALVPPVTPLADDAIRLEPLDGRYAPDFERLLEDAEIVRHTRVPRDRPPGFGATWVGRYTAGWMDASRAGFAILSTGGEFLGMAAIVELDLGGREGEIGYMVAPAARGQGVAGRALALITGWALGELGLERVELRIDIDNEASIRVAEQVGYVREGVFRSLHLKDGIRTDVAVYSLLPTDSR